MNDATITMSNGKVFQFKTNNLSNENAYLYCHENNQPFYIPVGDDGIYVNPMHIIYAEFKVINK